MPGGIDNVNPVVIPPARRCRRRDGNSSFLLLLHPVHDGSAVVNFPDLVSTAGVVQDAFGGGGLPASM